MKNKIKNKMKKMVSLILTLILSCTMLFGLTACESPSGDVDALNAQIETLTKQLEDANAEILVLEEEKALLESEISDLEAEITRLKSLMDGNSDEILAEIAALEAEVAALNNEKANLEAEISALNAQISNLNKENEELKALSEGLRNCLKNIHTFSGTICTTCGQKKEYSRDGDYIYFGKYPQTLKSDDVTITSTTDSLGYYLGSDGNYYAMVTAAPYVDNMAADRTSKSTFSTGAKVEEGTVYYFKVEPIRWRILTEENGEAFILCDSIIETVRYQVEYSYENSAGGYCTTLNGAPNGTYANNYKYSNVRTWLNETFYKTAFTSLQQEIVLAAEVDNSVDSTSSYEDNWNNRSDRYVCENTTDKVSLLSVYEVTNVEYGFAHYLTSDTARRMLTSDYSRAMGAYMSVFSEDYGSGWWWTRSPYESDSRQSCLIESDGLALFTYDVSFSGIGVVPTLRIKL